MWSLGGHNPSLLQTELHDAECKRVPNDPVNRQVCVLFPIFPPYSHVFFFICLIISDKRVLNILFWFASFSEYLPQQSNFLYKDNPCSPSYDKKTSNECDPHQSSKLSFSISLLWIFTFCSRSFVHTLALRFQFRLEKWKSVGLQTNECLPPPWPHPFSPKISALNPQVAFLVSTVMEPLPMYSFFEVQSTIELRIERNLYLFATCCTTEEMVWGS